MSQRRFINIEFPFQESNEGFLVKLNNTSKKAIRADLMHLLLTNKGERFYMPDFGTNLLKYIYEPNDVTTLNDIEFDLKTTVKKYIPNLNIDNLKVDFSDTNEYKATVRVDFSITDGVFKDKDFVIINV